MNEEPLIISCLRALLRDGKTVRVDLERESVAMPRRRHGILDAVYFIPELRGVTRGRYNCSGPGWKFSYEFNFDLQDSTRFLQTEVENHSRLEKDSDGIWQLMINHMSTPE